MESREPPHVHVAYAGRYAKFWLSPVTLADGRGFRGHELSELRRILLENRRFFVGNWDEYFGSQG
jgi:hypothetical protein